MVREDDGKGLKGRDALFLVDGDGKELWKEERTTSGWLTIAETLSNWRLGAPDYILAYRRGGGVYPALYDGYQNVVAEFRHEGYAVHGDLLGLGTEQVIIYDDELAVIFSSVSMDLTLPPSGRPLPHPKRLYNSTLYPGGEVNAGLFSGA
ncbi:hypothetical protein D3C77_378770 [compost metagenome]